MLNYKIKTTTIITVILDGKKVGTIIEAKYNKDGQAIGWQYCPQGKKKFGGEIYNSIDEVKESLNEPKDEFKHVKECFDTPEQD